MSSIEMKNQMNQRRIEEVQELSKVYTASDVWDHIDNIAKEIHSKVSNVSQRYMDLGMLAKSNELLNLAAALGAYVRPSNFDEDSLEMACVVYTSHNALLKRVDLHTSAFSLDKTSVIHEALSDMQNHDRRQQEMQELAAEVEEDKKRFTHKCKGCEYCKAALAAKTTEAPVEVETEEQGTGCCSSKRNEPTEMSEGNKVLHNAMRCKPLDSDIEDDQEPAGDESYALNP